MQRCLLAVLLLAAALAPAAHGHMQCSGSIVEVALVNDRPTHPVDYTSAFDKDGVEQHFGAIAPFEDWRRNVASTFSCIDSRGELQELGTPGGDMAEFAAAAWVYFNATGVAATDAGVKDAFDAFMEAVPTPERPFYFHTSHEKLHKVFHDVADAGVHPKPTVLPEFLPAAPASREAWLASLANGSHQGCGHVRLMIEQFADYGLDSPAVPMAAVRAFFEYWWGTPLHSAPRSKVKLAVVQGPLEGHAVTIVDSEGACAGHSPAIPPSYAGSQLFVYHAKAADDFRRLVVAPFFAAYAKRHGHPLDKAAFYFALKSLQARHLKATLDLLEPANALPVWAVTVKTDSAPAPAAAAAAGEAPAAPASPPATAAGAATARGARPQSPAVPRARAAAGGAAGGAAPSATQAAPAPGAAPAAHPAGPAHASPAAPRTPVKGPGALGGGDTRAKPSAL